MKFVYIHVTMTYKERTTFYYIITYITTFLSFFIFFIMKYYTIFFYYEITIIKARKVAVDFLSNQ